MKSKQIYLIYHSCNWLQLSRSKLSQFYCKMKQVGLCFQRRWSFTLMMRIYWHGTSPNIHPVMTVTERNHAPVRASPFIFFFLSVYISWLWWGFCSSKTIFWPKNCQELTRQTYQLWVNGYSHNQNLQRAECWFTEFPGMFSFCWNESW